MLLSPIMLDVFLFPYSPCFFFSPLFFLHLFLHVELDGRMRKKRMFRGGTCRLPFFYALCRYLGLQFSFVIWNGYLAGLSDLHWILTKLWWLTHCELLLLPPPRRRYYCFEVSDSFSFLWPASIHVQYSLSIIFLFSRDFVRTTYALMPTQGLLWKSQFRLISSSPYTGYESSYYSVSTSSLVTTDWLEMTTTMLKAWNLVT